jgi:hypothetical protein
MRRGLEPQGGGTLFASSWPAVERTTTMVATNVGCAGGLRPPRKPPLSGSAWWHANQAKFPNSTRVDDLEPGFRTKVQEFHAALAAAGAQVEINSTRRHKDRAYLMHYSWKIARGTIKPSKVPPRAGVDIEWDHGHLGRSRAAAQDMVRLFDMAHIAALTSWHIKGTAIDMTITWTGTLRIAKKSGQVVEINAPRNGAENRKLHAVGATYGVKKLLGDPPHWSANGL